MAAENGSDDGRKLSYRRLLAAALISLVLIFFLVLLTWLILRPAKPHFVLQNISVFALNLSAANSLTTTLQLTLAARNPNARIAILYDGIAASAAYRGRRITLPTRLPATYQGNRETIVWSPFVYGNQIPVAPELAAALRRDQTAGTLLVNVRAEGRIQWKVGAFATGRFRLNVNCPVYVSFPGRNKNGVAVGTATFQNQLIMDCHVDV